MTFCTASAACHVPPIRQRVGPSRYSTLEIGHALTLRTSAGGGMYFQRRLGV